ncbi:MULTISPECIES: cysteine-rich KTR domain-containing protein [Clostridia]|uniref:cysteine-rich KTR domain-containing protein n=1 Tax=Clostridia TaxID=186801 RepID=UPI00210EBDF3|nr:cysteine-rich KTR domain-containing protein [Enterocloster bolteae]MBQ5642379.1 cysteine-rich KTR domain-containing protein [Bacteroidaceae bacterium]MBR2709533.1 cysteine-rich KTR domain-containing protein [Candidatus Saccharibacteria bacterium]MCQ4756654.1 cysteine-rich KTR domain-containing protein [Enterocloster bolteae]
MKKTEWLLCPNCNNKTRIKICDNTVLENFPLYCPKCKQEIIISVKQFNTTVITEPDA